MDSRTNPTPAEMVAFRRSLRQRQGVVWIVIAVALGMAALIHIRELAGWWLAVLWGIAAILCVAVWRCPRCGRILDRNLAARECSHCYLRFDGSMPTRTPPNPH